MTRITVSLIRGYPPAATERSWPVVFKAPREPLLGLMAPLIILGGICSGVFTATEAASGAVIHILLSDRLVNRQKRVADLPEVIFQSGKTIGVIGMMIAMSAVFAGVLQTQGVARLLDDLRRSAPDARQFGEVMRLLPINPNISESVSDRIRAEAQRSASAGTEVEVLTAPFGVAYIETRFEALIGAYAAAQLAAEHHERFDVVIVLAGAPPAGLARASRSAAHPSGAASTSR